MRCRSTAEAAADRGGVTAETAVTLPSLVLVMGVALAAVQAGALQVACVDAARTGARAMARGDPEHAVRAAVVRTAPDSADIGLAEDGGLARVTVTAPVHLGPLKHLPIRVEGRAATPLESRDDPASGTAPGLPGSGPASPASPTADISEPAELAEQP